MYTNKAPNILYKSICNSLELVSFILYLTEMLKVLFCPLHTRAGLQGFFSFSSNNLKWEFLMFQCPLSPWHDHKRLSPMTWIFSNNNLKYPSFFHAILQNTLMKLYIGFLKILQCLGCIFVWNAYKMLILFICRIMHVRTYIHAIL